jgi:hypothetical protein
VINRDDMRFGWATEPTEQKRTYVQPNRSGFSEDDPEATECKRTYVQPNRSGFSGDDPEPAWVSDPGKRMEIREVRGRLEVVEYE